MKGKFFTIKISLLGYNFALNLFLNFDKRLRWSRGSVLAFGTQVRGFKPGFLRVNKSPQHVGGHGCLSVVSVMCCQVEVSETN